MAKTTDNPELTLRQRQAMEQRQIANNSLGPDQEHLTATDYAPAPLLEVTAEDPFGRNENNRRVYARLVAEKGNASGDRIKGNRERTMNDPDSPTADPENPTVGEKKHSERDSHIATLTHSAVIDNKPVTSGAPVATGSRATDAAMVTGPQTPAQADGGAAKGTPGNPWKNNA
jgi:hypothetical protein